MPVLLQFAVDQGPITLYDIWHKPVGETLDLIEWMLGFTVVGFNLAFDWFHLVKLYTIFRLCPRDWIPIEHIDEIALKEPEAQNGPCIKPANALDLMLHSRKGPYQSLMAREDIRIRKVPTALAYGLAAKLEETVAFDGIYFARTSDPSAPRWNVFDRKNRDGDLDPDFKDVVLRFNPSGALKFLAEHALGLTPKYLYTDVEPPKSWYPVEYGYAPTALAVSTLAKRWRVTDDEEEEDEREGDLYSDPLTEPESEDDEEVIQPKKAKRTQDRYAWPGVIKKFIEHWGTRKDARDYANDDIVYTRALDKHFGYPEPGDDDSVLACMVPVVRWRGFKINIEGIKELRAKAVLTVENSPVNTNKPAEVRRYITEAMDDLDILTSKIDETTNKSTLEKISRWMVKEIEPCLKCDGGECTRCKGQGQLNPGPHPAALRAKELLDVKFAVAEIKLYDKLLRAGKLHASFVVVGTLSNRMAGGDGLNAQGIKRAKEVRRQFPMAWDGYQLCGGDFSSYELTLVDAVYRDPKLRAILTGPKKLHGIMGTVMFPGNSYDQILASEGTENDMYTKAKSGVFLKVFGGIWKTFVDRLGISEEDAQRTDQWWSSEFSAIKEHQDRNQQKYCSMVQPGGVGTAVVWQEPTDHVESFLGFRRWFPLENMAAKAIFTLASKPPKEWKDCHVKVYRRDRVQTAAGAVASALYGAAFSIQAAVKRAADNHEIQSPGGQITKAVQRKVWNLQPCGVHPLYVALMNVHDELLSVTHPDYVEPVAQTVTEAVESFRPKVPLIGMTWQLQMDSWAEKKAGTRSLKIAPTPEFLAQAA
jgi:hypothetical protein